MAEWIKKHQKFLSLGVGGLLLVVGTAMLFWSYGESGVSKEERLAAERVARMEARVQAQISGTKAPPPEKSVFGEEYKEKQQQQLRYIVIAMLIGGVGFVGYGLLKKEA